MPGSLQLQTPYVGRVDPVRCPFQYERQARQELNPQPTVLETAALPVELLACDHD